MKEDAQFARMALAQGACTREQVREAMDLVADGESESLAASLLDLGYISIDTVEEIVHRIATGEVPPPSDDDLYEDDPADDPHKTQPLHLPNTCAECGRVIEDEELDEGDAMVFFGETYCPDCVSNTRRLFRLQDARHARAKRKYGLLEPQPPPETKAPPQEEEEEREETRRPEKHARKKKPSSRRQAAAKRPEGPPPLPKAGSVEEIPEEEIKELEKLVAKGKRDLARSRLGRTLKCSAKEAETALKTLEEEVLRPGGTSRGIFAFARNIARSTSFNRQVRRKNWVTVIEEGEAWLLEEPQNVDVLTSVAIAYREEGKPERAEKTFRRALEAPGDSWEAARNLADLLAEQDRWEEAWELYQEL
ncbi:MAG: hypothetical protein ACYS47_14930, partial [Planctomycetota bacterium]